MRTVGMPLLLSLLSACAATPDSPDEDTHLWLEVRAATLPTSSVAADADWRDLLGNDGARVHLPLRVPVRPDERIRIRQRERIPYRQDYEMEIFTAYYTSKPIEGTVSDGWQELDLVLSLADDPEAVAVDLRFEHHELHRPIPTYSIQLPAEALVIDQPRVGVATSGIERVMRIGETAWLRVPRTWTDATQAAADEDPGTLVVGFTFDR